MPSPASSRDSVLKAAQRTGAVRVGQHQPGDRLATAVEETLTTRPHPRSRMPGTTRSISASGDEHEIAVGGLPLLAREAQRVGPTGGPPVLVTRISTGPQRGLDLVHEGRRPVQVGAVVGRTPRAAPTSAAVASTRSREREVIATRAPSAASAAAMPRPMPFEAPVTSATRPEIPRSISRLSPAPPTRASNATATCRAGFRLPLPRDGHGGHSRPRVRGAARAGGARRVPAPPRVPPAHGADRRAGRRRWPPCSTPTRSSPRRRKRQRRAPLPSPRNTADRHVRRADDGEPRRSTTTSAGCPTPTAARRG